MKAIAVFGLGLMVLAGCKASDRACCAVPPAGSAPVSMGLPEMNATLDALKLALEDERKSEAMYMAVMKVHGERRPFSMVVNAERHHQQALIAQFKRLGAPIPAPTQFNFDIPETFEGACEMAVQAEIDNAALYDEIEQNVSDREVLRTFTMLRNATENCHLPAFKRAAGGDTEAGCGGACGQGQGKGKGQGAGCGAGGQGCGGGGCGQG